MARQHFFQLSSDPVAVGFMFDISERKRTEQQLITLQQELEELSFRDGLTNVANRRRFDALMEIEWGVPGTTASRFR